MVGNEEVIINKAVMVTCFYHFSEIAPTMAMC